MKVKKVITLLTAVLIALTIVPVARVAASSDELIPLMTNNVHSNNYISNERWTDTTKAYLYYEDGYYIRAEDDDGKFVIEKYDSSFVLKSSKSIDNELPLFGGCFIGSEYNFLIEGQENEEENDSKEIIRVIRYTKNWERVDACSIKGNNTIVPFDAGNLRAVEHDGKLYVRTCHKMYKYSDGLNHQANLTFTVDCNSMDLLFIYSTIMNNSVGYASHSFNQFIDVDKDTGRVVAVDHGDASPRAVVLFEYEQSFSSMTSSTAKSFYNTGYNNILPIQGGRGNNTTGVMVGGFKISESNYLTVLSSVLQDDNWATNKIRDIYVIATSKADRSTKTINLTNYDQSKTTTSNNPFIIDIGNGKYMVIWESKTIGNTDYLTNYVIIDENGNKLTDIKTAKANLSGCEPIVQGNNVIWYVSNNRTLDFYSVDKNTLELTTNSQTYTAATTTTEPTTEDPTTAASTTEAPTTAASTTAASTTAASTTAAPPTEEPTTAASTTAASTTAAPPTEEPTTAASTTAAPPTEEPTTAASTTADPTTADPTTADPTTADPTTADPTTADPTTADPTTADPTTADPTTADPTTADPTTETPTTAASTTDEGATSVNYILGDLNRDGVITAADARLALRMSAALVIYTEEDKIIADINEDNKVTAADARLILRVSAKLDSFEENPNVNDGVDDTADDFAKYVGQSIENVFSDFDDAIRDDFEFVVADNIYFITEYSEIMQDEIVTSVIAFLGDFDGNICGIEYGMTVNSAQNLMQSKGWVARETESPDTDFLYISPDRKAFLLFASTEYDGIVDSISYVLLDDIAEDAKINPLDYLGIATLQEISYEYNKEIVTDGDLKYIAFDTVSFYSQKQENGLDIVTSILFPCSNEDSYLFGIDFNMNQKDIESCISAWGYNYNGMLIADDFEHEIFYEYHSFSDDDNTYSIALEYGENRYVEYSIL